MQLTRSVLTSLVAVSPLVPLAHAVGFARVANNCANTTYAWSVGSSVGDMQTIDSGGVYSEPFRSDPVSGGISIKVCRTADGLFDGSPQTNFAYSLNGNLVWYDLSDVFGDAFNGSGLTVVPSLSSCPSIDWPTGVNPGGSQVKVCDSSANVTLTLCA